MISRYPVLIRAIQRFRDSAFRTVMESTCDSRIARIAESPTIDSSLSVG
ncbi:hypothetical protein QUF58_09710 [Anaerolineales bacterium HSG24]|nr:hypothetical protein [Anaerolineales bacterium HSG24]